MPGAEPPAASTADTANTLTLALENVGPMRSVGATAPAFELPAIVDGEQTRVGLDAHLGRSVILLAFYPGDFNPGCDDRGATIEDLELFALQQGVAVLAISGDSVHSHQAFADRYDLSVPLLSDIRGEVVADYGLGVADPAVGYRTRRAVVVVEPTGEIAFSWAGDDPAASPPIEKLRPAVEAAGGPEAAAERYRLGHACFVEGRRALEAGRTAHDEGAWERARERLATAEESLAAAAEHLNTAAGFAERDVAVETLQAGDDLAGQLETAADWLADAAAARVAGEGGVAESTRRDAERLLEGGAEATLPDPTVFPPAEPPAPLLAAAGADMERTAGTDGDLATAVPPADEAGGWFETAADSDGESTIGEAELAEITAAVERQTESE